ncbi:MAG: molybdopterin molybdotransferase MoeA [Sterolibacteriaceae bacterium]|nr:molybdopterin molybdotransferase MoeA [Sterolibacteriaceae bacterium]MBK9084230.1 molybdopterin molybdotransferase MoeA [Sterolibacteriaceae bacterium]
MNEAMLTLDHALAKLLAVARPIAEVDEVDTLECVGRVLAAPIRSGIDVPPSDNSMMDGYAVSCADVRTSGVRLRIAQRIPAGSMGHALERGTAARIFTGAPIPAGVDAIVMQELCEAEGDEVIINHVPRDGEWITRRGSDIHSGAEVLSGGTRLRPQEAGLAASVGTATVPVFRRLRVALFSTGSELVMPGERLPPGSIFNSNRFLLRGLIQSLGCSLTDFGIVRDDLEDTRRLLREAAQRHDLIVTCGGVSAGEEDHVRPAVQAEGELDLWKIALKPGKPLAYGRVRNAADGTSFVGLPGNPVSAFVTFVIVVRPLILKLQGAAHLGPFVEQRRAEFDLPKPDSRREFLRARVGVSGGLELFPNQSSAVLTSIAWADGLVDNPPCNKIRYGDLVRFLPFAGLLY